MLDGFDDYPIHQTAAPVRQTASGDLNHYDRYFFSGFTRDEHLYFGAAMGLYPNRRVIDAAFSVARDGEQLSVHASGLAPFDRAHTSVGPITVEVLEPLRRLRLIVDAPEHGLEADLIFAARTEAAEEPRFQTVVDGRMAMDYTRLTQMGRWSGWLSVDGERTECRPAEVLGSRDRSWGVRPVGERVAGAPGPAPQYFWLWAPVHFDDLCVLFDANDYSDGRRWHENGQLLSLLGDDAGAGAPAGAGGGEIESVRTVEHAIEWLPGTRRARRATITLVPWSGEPLVMEMEPIATFQMSGIGYFHPEFGHGHWKGELAVAGDRWKVPGLDPVAPSNIHIQALCRATLTGRGVTRRGFGALEQLALGPHQPTGLTGLFDGAPAR